MVKCASSVQKLFICIFSGQPEFSETSTPELDSLVKDIQKTLSGFIECNHDAWAPQIARVC